jgi:predicted transcriptional regulator
VLDEITENIENPESLLTYVHLNPKQRQLVSVISQIGPAAAAEISRHLGQDPSNVRKRLLTLVSLGQLERIENVGRIYYRLTQSGR